jgi:hypothetical protein
MRSGAKQVSRPCLIWALLRKFEPYVTPGTSAAKYGFVAKAGFGEVAGLKLVFICVSGLGLVFVFLLLG